LTSYCQKTLQLVQLSSKKCKTVPIKVYLSKLRYENHICSDGVHILSNEDEENQLIELHNQMGNKWSLIAHNIPGKYIITHLGQTIVSKTTSTPN